MASACSNYGHTLVDSLYLKIKTYVHVFRQISYHLVERLNTIVKTVDHRFSLQIDCYRWKTCQCCIFITNMTTWWFQNHINAYFSGNQTYKSKFWVTKRTTRRTWHPKSKIQENKSRISDEGAMGSRPAPDIWREAEGGPQFVKLQDQIAKQIICKMNYLKASREGRAGLIRMGYFCEWSKTSDGLIALLCQIGLKEIDSRWEMIIAYIHKTCT